MGKSPSENAIITIPTSYLVHTRGVMKLMPRESASP